MTKYLLRDANDNDHKFLFVLLKASMFPYYKKTFGHWDDKEEWDFLMESLSGSHYQIILVDGIEVGCLALKEDSDSLFIDEIQILPEMQGKGIGSQILRDLIESTEKSKRLIKLEVIKSNPDALALYQRFGFISDGENETHFKLKRKPYL